MMGRRQSYWCVQLMWFLFLWGSFESLFSANFMPRFYSPTRTAPLSVEVMDEILGVKPDSYEILSGALEWKPAPAVGVELPVRRAKDFVLLHIDRLLGDEPYKTLAEKRFEYLFFLFDRVAVVLKQMLQSSWSATSHRARDKSFVFVGKYGYGLIIRARDGAMFSTFAAGEIGRSKDRESIAWSSPKLAAFDKPKCVDELTRFQGIADRLRRERR